MTTDTLAFVFRKAIIGALEKTVLRYVLVQVENNVGIPLLKNQIEAALQQEQPEAIRQLLFAALQKLEQPSTPPGEGIIATEPTRVYRIPPEGAVVTQQTL